MFNLPINSSVVNIVSDGLLRPIGCLYTTLPDAARAFLNDSDYSNIALYALFNSSWYSAPQRFISLSCQ